MLGTRDGPAKCGNVPDDQGHLVTLAIEVVGDWGQPFIGDTLHKTATTGQYEKTNWYLQGPARDTKKGYRLGTRAIDKLCGILTIYRSTAIATWWDDNTSAALKGSGRALLP